MIRSLIALLIVGIVLGLYARFVLYSEKAVVSTEYIIAQLSKSSELTTAKLKYTGVTQYTDEGLPILSKADFLMVYSATARLGIDVNDIKIELDNKSRIVWITIPAARIHEVKVDPSSIKYYDTKFALFNTDEKEDANLAQTLAEKAAEKEVANLGVLEYADQQSETLIKGLIMGIIPKDYEIRVR